MSRSSSRLCSVGSLNGFSIPASRASSRWICQQCSSKLRVRQQSTQNLRGPLLQRTLTTARSEELATSNIRQSDVSINKYRSASTSTDDAKAAVRDLPSQEEGRRSHAAKRFSHLMDHVQSNIFIAGQRLNDLTGYSGIEALKRDIEGQEQLVQSTRTSLQAAREAYSTAISQRSSSQREVNELLQRKHAWTPNDLERFTALYRSDHANEQTETAAQENLVASERRAEEVAAKLSASILARYHEEQIWSDKIRRMSTWGTWGLMGVNVLLFLVFQIGVEPWRRKRLVKGFEDKVMEALDREAQPSRDMAVSSKVADQSLTASSSSENMIPTATESEPKLMLLANEAKPSENNLVAIEPDGRSALGIHPTLTIFQRMQSLVQDLFSKREVVISRLDLTVVALEGAAAGTVIATAVLMLFKYR